MPHQPNSPSISAVPVRGRWIMLLLGGWFTAATLAAASLSADPVVPYGVPGPAMTDPDFAVTVNGVDIPTDRQRWVTTAHFAFAGIARIVVTFREPVTGCRLSPLSSGVVPAISGGTVSFAISEPRSLVLHRLNGLHEVDRIRAPRLLLFADALEDDAPRIGDPGVVDVTTAGVARGSGADQGTAFQRIVDDLSAAGGGTAYVPPGLYLFRRLDLKPKVRLHLAGGARMQVTDDSDTNTAIWIYRADGAAVTGPGEISANGIHRRFAADGPGIQTSVIVGWESDDVVISGVTLRDPSMFNCFVRMCSGWRIEGVKLIDYSNEDLGAYGGEDGIDLDECREVTVQDVFIGSGDDSTAIKAVGTGRFATTGNHRLMHLTILNHASGAALDVGDTAQSAVAGIEYRNIDILDCLFAASVANADVDEVNPSGTSSLDDVCLRNIRTESVRGTLLRGLAAKGPVGTIEFQRFTAPGWGTSGTTQPYGNVFAGTAADRRIGEVILDGVRVGGELVTRPGGFAVGSHVEAVTYRDSAHAVVEWEVATATGRPGSPAIARLRRTGPTTDPLTVHLGARGTFRPGSDYTATPAQVVIPAGASAVDVAVAPLAATAASEGTVLLQLDGAAAGGAYLEGPHWQAYLRLRREPAERAFTITASSGAHGTVVPSGATTVAPGGGHTYAITPEPGYAIASLTIDGKQVAPSATWAFADVGADHTIAATFGPVAPPSGGGSAGSAAGGGAGGGGCGFGSGLAVLALLSLLRGRRG